jgi:hypothetical protein
MENTPENSGCECFKMFQVPAHTKTNPNKSDWIRKNDYKQQVSMIVNHSQVVLQDKHIFHQWHV